MTCHSYIFFDSQPSIHALGHAELEKCKTEFAKLCSSAASSASSISSAVSAENQPVMVRAFSTLGLKAGSRFMLHFEAEHTDEIQSLLNKLMHTPLGAHLNISYTLFGMTRPSQYSPKHHQHIQADQENVQHQSNPGNVDKLEQVQSQSPKRYFIVYPFTKTEDWYALSFDERREMMKEHVMVGRKYTQIEQLLLYSYGVDDHDFVVSYETDSLQDFQSLVMKLRTTRGRRYTKNDTPMFTCLSGKIEDALAML